MDIIYFLFEQYINTIAMKRHKHTTYLYILPWKGINTLHQCIVQSKYTWNNC